MSSSPKRRKVLQPLSQKEIAAAFGVTTRTIQRWHDEGLPRQGTGRDTTYDLPECIAWRLEREREEVERILETFENEEASRKKKLAMQARKLELEVEEMEGRLIDIEDLEQLHSAPLAELRGQILSIPGRLGPLLDRYKVQEAVAILDEFVAEFMESLSHLRDVDVEGG